MARFRVCLTDVEDVIKKAVTIECPSEDLALDYAKTLIKENGRVELWRDVTIDGPQIGSLQPRPDAWSSAWVRPVRPTSRLSSSEPFVAIIPDLGSGAHCVAPECPEGGQRARLAQQHLPSVWLSGHFSTLI